VWWKLKKRWKLKTEWEASRRSVPRLVEEVQRRSEMIGLKEVYPTRDMDYI
jgi:hypothetical protein